MTHSPKTNAYGSLNTDASYRNSYRAGRRTSSSGASQPCSKPPSGSAPWTRSIPCAVTPAYVASVCRHPSYVNIN
jgi:hypothetical protein